MKSYHNIETRKFPGKDYYVGYSNLGSVRIYKSAKPRSRNWVGYREGAFTLVTKTLAEMSKKLEQL